MFDSSYPIVFLAWFLGGFVNGVSGMGAAMVALPIVACVLEMNAAVPSSCLVATVVAIYVAWMYRAHCRCASVVPMFVGCIPGAFVGVYVLRVVPGVWLQAVLGLVLVVYVLWQRFHRAGAAHPESVSAGAVSGFASGFANAAISFSGPPAAMYALHVGWDKDTARGTLGFYFLGICIVTCAMQAVAGFFTPVVLKAALYGMPGALAGLFASLPFARTIRENVFQAILLVMIGLAGLICIIRAAQEMV